MQWGFVAFEVLLVSSESAQAVIGAGQRLGEERERQKEKGKLQLSVLHKDRFPL